MIILNEYTEDITDGTYSVKPKRRITCPICGGKLKVRDSKRRKLICSESEVRTYRLRRLKCQSCGALHQEMPDCFVPYKHYSRGLILLALNGDFSACPAENSTIYRWSQEHRLLGETHDKAQDEA